MKIPKKAGLGRLSHNPEEGRHSGAAAPLDTFEGSLEKLEAIVHELEAGQKGLEDSLELFEKGIGLAKGLTKELEEAKHKVEVLTKEGGKLVKSPLND